MIFTSFHGAWLIEPDIHKDNRGSLTLVFDERVFNDKGLNSYWPLQLQTITRGCGVVRGMHWQGWPKAQIKLVRCVVGFVTDVIVDIRPESPEFGKPHQVELSGDDMRSLYIPTGFAHGFQCVSEYCIMHYSLSALHFPQTSKRFNPTDEEVGIKWPVLVMGLSDEDASAPPLSHAIQSVR